MQKECSLVKTSLDIPTQIEIRHVLFIRKGYKSSVVLIIAANISDLIQQYSEQATIVYTKSKVRLDW